MYEGLLTFEVQLLNSTSSRRHHRRLQSSLTAAEVAAAVEAALASGSEYLAHAFTASGPDASQAFAVEIVTRGGDDGGCDAGIAAVNDARFATRLAAELEVTVSISPPHCSLGVVDAPSPPFSPPPPYWCDDVDAGTLLLAVLLLMHALLHAAWPLMPYGAAFAGGAARVLAMAAHDAQYDAKRRRSSAAGYAALFVSALSSTTSSTLSSAPPASSKQSSRLFVSSRRAAALVRSPNMSKVMSGLGRAFSPKRTASGHAPEAPPLADTMHPSSVSSSALATSVQPASPPPIAPLKHVQSARRQGSLDTMRQAGSVRGMHAQPTAASPPPPSPPPSPPLQPSLPSPSAPPPASLPEAPPSWAAFAWAAGCLLSLMLLPNVALRDDDDFKTMPVHYYSAALVPCWLAELATLGLLLWRRWERKYGSSAAAAAAARASAATVRLDVFKAVEGAPVAISPAEDSERHAPRRRESWGERLRHPLYVAGRSGAVRRLLQRMWLHTCVVLVADAPATFARPWHRLMLLLPPAAVVLHSVASGFARSFTATATSPSATDACSSRRSSRMSSYLAPHSDLASRRSSAASDVSTNTSVGAQPIPRAVLRRASLLRALPAIGEACGVALVVAMVGVGVARPQWLLRCDATMIMSLLPEAIAALILLGMPLVCAVITSKLLPPINPKRRLQQLLRRATSNERKQRRKREKRESAASRYYKRHCPTGLPLPKRESITAVAEEPEKPEKPEKARHLAKRRWKERAAAAVIAKSAFDDATAAVAALGPRPAVAPPPEVIPTPAPSVQVHTAAATPLVTTSAAVDTRLTVIADAVLPPLLLLGATALCGLAVASVLGALPFVADDDLIPLGVALASLAALLCALAVRRLRRALRRRSHRRLEGRRRTIAQVGTAHAHLERRESWSYNWGGRSTPGRRLSRRFSRSIDLVRSCSSTEVLAAKTELACKHEAGGGATPGSRLTPSIKRESSPPSLRRDNSTGGTRLRLSSGFSGGTINRADGDGEFADVLPGSSRASDDGQSSGSSTELSATGGGPPARSPTVSALSPSTTTPPPLGGPQRSSSDLRLQRGNSQTRLRSSWADGETLSSTDGDGGGGAGGSGDGGGRMWLESARSFPAEDEANVGSFNQRRPSRPPPPPPPCSSFRESTRSVASEASEAEVEGRASQRAPPRPPRSSPPRPEAQGGAETTSKDAQPVARRSSAASAMSWMSPRNNSARGGTPRRSPSSSSGRMFDDVVTPVTSNNVASSTPRRPSGLAASASSSSPLPAGGIPNPRVSSGPRLARGGLAGGVSSRLRLAPENPPRSRELDSPATPPRPPAAPAPAAKVARTAEEEAARRARIQAEIDRQLGADQPAIQERISGTHLQERIPPPRKDAGPPPRKVGGQTIRELPSTPARLEARVQQARCSRLNAGAGPSAASTGAASSSAGAASTSASVADSITPPTDLFGPLSRADLATAKVAALKAALPPRPTGKASTYGVKPRKPPPAPPPIDVGHSSDGSSASPEPARTLQERIQERIPGTCLQERIPPPRKGAGPPPRKVGGQTIRELPSTPARLEARVQQARCSRLNAGAGPSAASTGAASSSAGAASTSASVADSITPPTDLFGPLSRADLATAKVAALKAALPPRPTGKASTYGVKPRKPH